MDRNNVIGFTLLGVLIIAFFFMQSRYAAQDRMVQAKKQHTEDSIKLANQPKIDRNLLKEKTQPVVQTIVPDSLKKNLSTDQVKKLEDSLKSIENGNIYGPFAALMEGAEKIDSIENDFLKIVFTNKGGRILRAELKKYKDYRGGKLDLINGNENKFNYTFSYRNTNNDNIYIETEKLFFTSIKSADAKSITFIVDAGEGRSLEQKYAFNDTSYLLDYNLKFNNFDKIIPSQSSTISLSWQDQIQNQEKNITYERQYSKLYFSYANGDVDYKNANGELKFDSKVKWVSCQQQFFNATLIAKNNFDNSGKIAVFATDTSKFVKLCNTELYLSFNNQSVFEFPMQWYLAPNDYKALKSMDLSLQDIVPTGTGIIGWINKAAVIPLFNWLSGFVSNYGLVILLMTLIIKLILSPLTYRSYLSMAKMRVLNPEIAEIKEKYKDDQAKFGQEQLKLFRKAGVNPLGGCIPTLLGMPILIAMFRLFPGNLHLRQQSFLWAKDMSTYDDLIHWSFNIPFIGMHLSIFCVLMTLSSMMYIRLNMQNSTQLAGPMKTVQYISPIFFLLFLNSSPAGLTYYYFVSNITTFAQQWGIRKFLINDAEIHRRIQENKAKPEKKKSGFAKRLEDAMKQQQTMRNTNQKQSKNKK